ncbi:MAG: hypothetical protein JOY54_14990 [Acidobacteriaceae bacterium]|nr:hypothetical protein [Acidobacteriaceae bacterium]
MTKRILLSLLAAVSLLNADTLVLRDGTRIDGRLLGSDGESVRFQASGGQASTYYRDQIESLRFGKESGSYQQGAAYPPPNPGYSQNPPQGHPPDTYAAPAGAPAGSVAGVEVPAGTQIVVRLIDPVNSERDTLGQTYRATIDEPVLENGQAVIPRGADAVVALVDDQQSGKFAGRTVMTLALRNVTVNGRAYDVTTAGVAQASSSRGKRSGEVIGGTAALGAIIGAIAGGGKGAAIGAGSGAAVGAAGQVLTSGQKVKVPSETRLTFTLQNPIDL